eukprot:Sspe_Gene.9857::Locus_3315_Transcript_1_1_Confidence_1.000_Length_2242::g.9857::m.9857
MGQLHELVEKLCRQFPEEPVELIKEVCAQTPDECVASFRLYSRHEYHRDPYPEVPVVRPLPPLPRNTFNGFPTSPLPPNLPLAAGDGMFSMPTEEHHPQREAEADCPACLRRLNLIMSSHTYPYKYECKECGTSIRVAVPLDDIQRTSETVESTRTTWPACEFCGYQMPSLTDRSIHMNSNHPAELHDMQKLRDYFRTTTPPDLEAEAMRKKMEEWGKMVGTMVGHRLDNDTTYQFKVETVKQIEVMVRNLFPQAKVYLFGSTVSGISEKKSDIDVAVKLGQKTRGVVRDVAAIDSIFHVLSKTGLPWAPGDWGLRKVTRTRVPILGNIPSPISSYTPGKELSRTLMWVVRQEDYEKHVANINTKFKPPPKRVSVDKASQSIFAVFDNETDALQAKMKDTTAVFPDPSAVPIAFQTMWDLSLRFFGVRNSFLLRRYLSSPEMRLGAAAAKIWSRKVGLNDHRNGMLSSYAVTIMFIYAMLAESRCAYIDPESIDPHDVEAPTFDDSISPIPPFAGSLEGSQTDGGLFLRFLRFYAVDFQWSQSVITLSENPAKRVVVRSDRNWVEENEVIVDRAKSIYYRICIEDPYEKADSPPLPGGRLNLGRKVPSLRALRVQKSFRDSWTEALEAPQPISAILQGP